MYVKSAKLRRVFFCCGFHSRHSLPVCASTMAPKIAGDTSVESSKSNSEYKITFHSSSYYIFSLWRRRASPQNRHTYRKERGEEKKGSPARNHFKCERNLRSQQFRHPLSVKKLKVGKTVSTFFDFLFFCAALSLSNDDSKWEGEEKCDVG